VTAQPDAAGVAAFVANAVAGGSVVFETMSTVTIDTGLNSIELHTWGDDHCCLPKGAIRVTLADPDRRLIPGGTSPNLLFKGMLLAFVEVSGPEDDDPPDPTHRQVVRLTKVGPVRTDPLFHGNTGGGTDPLQVVDVEWDPADALQFPLCLNVVRFGGRTGQASVAQGNIVLADHGQTISETLPVPPPPDGPAFRPKLSNGPVTFQGQVVDSTGTQVTFDASTPASAALVVDPRTAQPAIILQSSADCDPTADPVDPWLPLRDLLETGPFSQNFVVETENDGSAELRFGDGQLGAKPLTALHACYRVGLGTLGNIGNDALVHVVTADSAAATALDPIAPSTNLIPATGGTEPEPLDEIRLSAPQAFRVQERAVTAADYSDIALRHPGVQRAVATRRFTGSWYTMFVAVDRLGGLPVDAAFKQDFASFLEPFRLAGLDLEIQGAVLVPLDIMLTVCVRPGFFRFNVKKAILDALSSSDLPDGTRGFFHPDNLTFGQPIFLSQIIAAVLAVPGVGTVETGDGDLRFKRARQVVDPKDAADGVLRMGPLEIAELDNDVNRPENGTLELVMQGGS
jgi:hypothetical protein